jgi:hypothetical protein
MTKDGSRARAVRKRQLLLVCGAAAIIMLLAGVVAWNDAERVMVRKSTKQSLVGEHLQLPSITGEPVPLAGPELRSGEETNVFHRSGEQK